MGAKQLDEEIFRAADTRYNYVESVKKAKVTAVNGYNTVNVTVESLDLPLINVPVLRPNYEITLTGSDPLPTISWTFGLNVGDEVAVAFLNGHAGNPLVIGKF